MKKSKILLLIILSLMFFAMFSCEPEPVPQFEKIMLFLKKHVGLFLFAIGILGIIWSYVFGIIWRKKMKQKNKQIYKEYPEKLAKKEKDDLFCEKVYKNNTIK